MQKQEIKNKVDELIKKYDKVKGYVWDEDKSKVEDEILGECLELKPHIKEHGIDNFDFTEQEIVFLNYFQAI